MLNMSQKRLHFVNITIGVHWTVITCYFMVLQNDKDRSIRRCGNWKHLFRPLVWYFRSKGLVFIYYREQFSHNLTCSFFNTLYKTTSVINTEIIHVKIWIKLMFIRIRSEFLLPSFWRQLRYLAVVYTDQLWFLANLRYLRCAISTWYLFFLFQSPRYKCPFFPDELIVFLTKLNMANNF